MVKNKESASFRVRFVVVHGSMPFFIGLPTLKAMGAALNFCFSSLSLPIRQSTYRPDLAVVDSPLRLTLLYKCRQFSTLRIGNKNNKATHARAVPTRNAQKHITALPATTRKASKPSLSSSQKFNIFAAHQVRKTLQGYTEKSTRI